MLKNYSSIVFILTLVLVLGSCSSSKNVVETGNDSSSMRKPHLNDKQNNSLQYSFFEANKQKVLGNYKAAEEWFKKCLKLDPNNAACHFELAMIYEMKGDMPEALKSAKKATDLYPNNSWYQLVLGGMYESNRQFSNAAEVYEKLVQNDPNNLDNYYYWINSLVYSNDLQKAVDVYDLLEQKLGVQEEFSIKKQKIYLSLKNNDAAIVEIEKLLKTDPTNTRYLNILAELYQMTGDTEKAMDLYVKILEKDPTNAMVHLALSEQYRLKGDTLKSKEELVLAFKDQNLGIDPKVRILLKYFTMEGLKPGLEKEAILLGNTLVETHPKEAKAFSVLGDLLYRVDSLDWARESYRQAIELDESKFLVWNQVMLLNSELSDFKSMYTESSKAIELFPSQPAFYLFKGIAALQRDSLPQSIEALEMGKELVVDNVPLLAQFYSSLGDAYHKQKNYPASDSAYDKSLELDPNNVYVLNNYSYYLSLRLENLEKAKKMSAKSLELDPNSQSFTDTYGWILYQLKDYPEAKKYIKKSMDLGGENSPVILEHYGDVLFKLGNKEEAISFWEKALSKGKGSNKLKEKVEQKTLIE